ncbi:MAG: hypothetical protein ACYDCJ_05015 [Gammaproteobacteria bacterium]
MSVHIQVSKYSRNYSDVLVYAVSFLFFIAITLLASYAGRSIITNDQWHYLGIIKDYYQHQLSFSDLWSGHGVHRQPIYRLLFLIDAIYFHLNVKLEIYVGLSALLLMSILIYSHYKASLQNIVSPLKSQLGFLVIAAVLFSFNQWALYFFSLSALDEFLGNLLFVWLWCYMDVGIRRSLTHGFIVIFGLIYTLLLLAFGEGRGAAVIIATLIVVFLAGRSQNGLTNPKFRLLVAVTVVCSIGSQLIYWYVPPRLEQSGQLINNFLYVLTHLWGAIQFSVFTLGSSLLNRLWVDYYSNYRPAMYIIGIVVIFGYMYAAWLFIKYRMWKKTWLPLVFVLYSLLFLGLLVVGRYGADYIGSTGAPRYATDLQFGIIGILWIFFYAYNSVSPFPGMRIKSIIVCSITFVILMQIGSGLLMVKIAASYKRFDQNFVHYIVNLKPVENPSTHRVSLCPNLALCIQGIEILKRYNLKPFQASLKPSVEQ